MEEMSYTGYLLMICIMSFSLILWTILFQQDKRIKTNKSFKTNLDNVYAIGDVASPPWLAHKASHEGISVAEQVAGLKVHPIKKDRIPACTYCDPEVASIGLTEREAIENGFDFKIGMFPFSANGKALAMGYEYGFIKTIIHKATGEFLGVHMVGMGAVSYTHLTLPTSDLV